MIPISGIYEVAIPVRDVPRAEAFYREVLGLEVGLRDARRNWVFLRAGGLAGMLVLQEETGEWPSRHFAFSLRDADLDRAAAALKDRGVAVEGPVALDWIPARSIYFADPDGHLLELCATLEPARS